MRQKNIGIVTLPGPAAGDIPLSNFAKIISQISENVYLITGRTNTYAEYNLQQNLKNVEIITINYNSKANILMKVICFIALQIKYALQVMKLNKYVTCWTFFFAERGPLLPIVIARVMKKDTIVILGGSFKNIISSKAKRKSFGDIIMILLERGVCSLSGFMVVYSQSLIEEWTLEKYKNKIIIAHEHILNFDKFKIIKKYNAREILIAYIGRLSGEKGVLNFVKAISLIHNENNGKFMIGGDGDLRVKIEKYLNENNLSDNVKLTGWISHDELPEYLNELKLLVLPSYTEGLPNIMLEAMACGTPVLATPVGAIPDIIKDGETGFILEDNSPECIAESVIKIIKLPDYELERVSKNARSLVEREFAFEKTVERWRTIFRDI